MYRQSILHDIFSCFVWKLDQSSFVLYWRVKCTLISQRRYWQIENLLSTQKQFIFLYRKWSLNKNILYYPYQNIRVTVSYIPFPDNGLSTTGGHVTYHSRKSLLVLALDQILLIKCKVTWSNVQQRNRPLIAIPLSGTTNYYDWGHGYNLTLRILHLT